MHVLINHTVSLSAQLLRSPQRVKCATCGKRRVGYRLVIWSGGTMLGDLMPWRCATDTGITRPIDPDGEPTTDNIVRPVFDWDGVYETPLLKEARASVALDHDEDEGTHSVGDGHAHDDNELLPGPSVSTVEEPAGHWTDDLTLREVDPR